MLELASGGYPNPPDFSFEEVVYKEGLTEILPQIVAEYVQKHTLKEVSLCGIGSGFSPEFVHTFLHLKETHPETLVDSYNIDLAYETYEAQIVFLSIIAQQLGIRDSSIEMTQEREWLLFNLSKLLTIGVTPLFHGRLLLPSSAKTSVVSAVHVLNYIPAQDFLFFIKDPRIKIVCVLNGQDRGYREIFHENRFKNSTELEEKMVASGFSLLRQIKSANNKHRALFFERI